MRAEVGDPRAEVGYVEGLGPAQLYGPEMDEDVTFRGG